MMFCCEVARQLQSSFGSMWTVPCLQTATPGTGVCENQRRCSFSGASGDNETGRCQGRALDGKLDVRLEWRSTVRSLYAVTIRRQRLPTTRGFERPLIPCYVSLQTPQPPGAQRSCSPCGMPPVLPAPRPVKPRNLVSPIHEASPPADRRPPRRCPSRSTVRRATRALTACLPHVNHPQTRCKHGPQHRHPVAISGRNSVGNSVAHGAGKQETPTC